MLLEEFVQQHRVITSWLNWTPGFVVAQPKSFAAAARKSRSFAGVPQSFSPRMPDLAGETPPYPGFPIGVVSR